MKAVVANLLLKSGLSAAMSVSQFHSMSPTTVKSFVKSRRLNFIGEITDEFVVALADVIKEFMKLNEIKHTVLFNLGVDETPTEQDVQVQVVDGNVAYTVRLLWIYRPTRVRSCFLLSMSQKGSTIYC